MISKNDPIIWSFTDGHDSGINQFNYETGETKHAELDKLIDTKHAFLAREFEARGQSEFLRTIISRLLDSGWTVPEHLVLKQTNATPPRFNSLQFRSSMLSIIDVVGSYNKTGSVEIVNDKILPHHMCHALSAYHCSPFKDCVVITWDGIGDGKYYSESVFKNNKLVDFYSPSFFVGVGMPMGYVGHVCKRHISPHVTKRETSSFLDYAGKVMGLASYFEKTKDNEEFYYEMVGDYKKIMTALPDYQAWLSGYHFQKLNEQSNPARAWENGWNDPESERKEIWTEKEEILHCAAVQRASNEVLYDQVNSKGLQKKIEGAGNNLVISGGNAMNVITNTYVKDNKDYNVFVPPDPGDSGLSFGMSVWKAEQLGWKGYSHNKRPSRRQCDITFDTRYLGDGLKNSKIVTTKNIADMIKEGKIIGIIQGNVENGPRALGFRSILCNPEFPDMRDRINANIKNREWYRPFAPVCRKEDARQWFDSRSFDYLEHMSFAVRVKQDKIKLLPSITHVDNTARLQTVTKESNSLLYEILSHHKNVLLNTSFNVQGKPILNSWETAKHILDTTDLHNIVIQLNNGQLRLV